MTRIKLRGVEYPALFDLAAVKQLQDRYGDLTKMNEKMLELDELAYTVAAMIREGVALENELQHTDREAPTVEAVRKLLTFADMTGQSRMVKAVQDEIIDFWGEPAEKKAQRPTTRTTSSKSRMKRRGGRRAR